MNLNERMEFDSPIEIREDGSIIDRHDLFAPDFFESQVLSDKWIVFGEYHDSEFIGGGLEQTLLERPGVYVVVANSWENDSDDAGIREAEPYVLEGWAILEFNG